MYGGRFVFMHVNKTRKIAVLSTLAALSTILVVLGTVISVNTVFFTAAAAFLAGIVTMRYGIGYSAVFFAVCTVLDFIFNPDKLHIFLYMGFAGYLLLSEGTYRILPGREGKKKERMHLGLRLIIFEILYVPLLLFIPRLLISDSLMNMTGFFPIMMIVGLLAWFLYDLAYTAFKRSFFQRFGKAL